jgi:predicted O-methyltransferase YrrM
LSIVEKNTKEVQQFVQDHLEEDPAQLLLRHAHRKDLDVKFAVHQIQSRQKLKNKIPSWLKNSEVILPASISLEQASSEITATFKASLVSGGMMVDLTGGMGIDAFYLSQNFHQTIYCERNNELFELTMHNFQTGGLKNIQGVEGDSIAFLQSSSPTFDLIYVDPARRNVQQKKVFQLSDCEPDVVNHWALLKAKSTSIMIKASPILDLKSAIKELPGLNKIWVVAYKNEVKELVLFWKKGDEKSDPVIGAVELNALNQTFEFTFEEEENSHPEMGDAESYIIEPYASILKAGAFKLFSERYALRKLHPNTHLYTSSLLNLNVPGKIYQIQNEITQPKKEIKQLFPSGKVNVVTRNYVLKAEEVKKKYQLKDGGDDFLICANSNGQQKLWYCKKVN